MGESLISYLQRFTDNAHIGKIVTDVGSGFIMGLGFAFWLGTVFDVTVLPYHRRLELESSKIHLEARVLGQTTSIVQLLDQCPEELRSASRIQSEDIDPTVPLSVVSEFIKTQVDLVHAKVITAMEEDKAKRFGTLCGTSPDDATNLACEKLDKEIVQTRLFYPRLSTRIALLQDSQNRLKAIVTEQQKARDLWENIAHLFSKLEILVFIGGLMGVLLSQISRQLILRWLYQQLIPWLGSLGSKAERHSAEILSDEDITDRIIEAVAAGKMKREQHDVLVSDYFRYAEASANMVIPTLVLGFGFVFYMWHIGPPSPAGFLWVVCAVTVSGATLLTVSGYNSNNSYLRKAEGLLRGVNQLALGAPAKEAEPARAPAAAAPAAEIPIAPIGLGELASTAPQGAETALPTAPPK